MARRGSSLGSRARVLSSLARGPAQRTGLLSVEESGDKTPPAKAKTPQGNRCCVQRFPSGSGAFLPPTQSTFRNTFGERHLPL